MWLKIVWEIVTEKQRGCLEVFFGVVLYFLSRLLRSPNVKILQLFPLLTNYLYLNGPWTHLDFISALLFGTKPSTPLSCILLEKLVTTYFILNLYSRGFHGLSLALPHVTS